MRPRAGLLACILLLSACQGDDDASSGRRPSTVPAAITVVAPDVPADPEPACGPGEGGRPGEPVRITTLEDAQGSRAAGEAVEAFAAACNQLGGVAGRPVVVEVRRVGTVEEQVAAVEEACRDRLALVGSAVRLDVAAAQIAVDCGLPDVPADAVNPLHSDATNVVAPLPNPVGTFDVGPARQVQAAGAPVERAAILFTAGADELNARRQVEAYERIGWSFVYQATLSGTDDDLDVHALQLRERDARLLVVRAPRPSVAALLTRLSQAGVRPEFVEADDRSYDPSLPAEVGAAAEGLRIASPIVPYDPAGDEAAPELRRYRGWLEAVHPGSAPTATGVRAWSAALLFARAAASAAASESGLDRSTLRLALGSVGEWDGHGLHAPTDPAGNRPAACFAYVRVEGGRFVREHPAEGLACGDHQLGLIGDYGEGAKPRVGS